MVEQGRKFPHKPGSWFTLGVAAVLVTSCGGEPTAPQQTQNTPTVASVEVTPGTATIEVGGTTQLAATPKDASGNTVSGQSVTWSSSSDAIATVSASGLVTGQSVGTATITASAGGQSGTATVAVNQVPVASVAVDPGTANLRAKTATQLTATLKDAAGNDLTGRTVAWSSSDDDVATVNSSGLVVAVASGTATIFATSEGETGQATVTVFTGFTGAYETGNWSKSMMCPGPCWTSSGIAGGTTTIDPVNGDTESVTLGYNVNLGNPGGGVSLRTATFSTVATGTGTVSLDWTYAGYHAFFQVNARLTVFAETAAGTTTIVEIDQAAGGGFNFAGSTSIDVEAGRNFGIIVGGSNNDSDSRLQGSVVMTNFSGPVGGSTSISPASGEANEADFSYDVNLGNPGGGVSVRTATFSVVAQESGTVTFDWLYTGFHAFAAVNAELTVFAERAAGTTTVVEIDQAAGGNSFTFSGTSTIQVEAGKPFGIIVGGSNFDSNSRLRGTVTISKLNAP
jgi:uncharacterized protein YjdB